MSKINHWNVSEIEILKLEYGHKSISQLSVVLNRSCSAIVQKAKTLGLNSRPHWTAREIKIIVDANGQKTFTELLQLLPNRTKEALKQKLEQLQLQHLSDRWSEKELELLEQLYIKKIPLKQIAKILNRTVSAIKIKRRKLKIDTNRHRWTKNEKELLRQIYTGCPQEELEQLFPNKTYQQICRKANCMNLRQVISFLWPEKDILKLKESYPNMTINELKILFPDKTKTQIRDKAKTMRLTRNLETLARCLRMQKVPDWNHRTNWRKKILKRDMFKCQKCGTEPTSTLELQAHHIYTVKSRPDLKYDINNGITLCLPCHYSIHSKEDLFVDQFLSTIGVLK